MLLEKIYFWIHDEHSLFKQLKGKKNVVLFLKGGGRFRHSAYPIYNTAA